MILHYYVFSYAFSRGFTNVIIGFEENYITKSGLETAEKAAFAIEGFPVGETMALLSVSYLGAMTKEVFHNEQPN